LIRDCRSHYELAINDLSEKPTVISSSIIGELTTTIQKVEKQKPLVLYAPSGIAGANIKEMIDMTKEEAEAFSLAGIKLVKTLLAYEPIIIGVFDRYLLGGGLEIALACDLTIVTESCKVGFPEVTLGITPGWLGIELCAIKNPALIQELLFLGKIIEAKQSYSYSLFNSVCQNWQTAQDELAKMIDQLDICSYAAIASAKRQYWRSLNVDNLSESAKTFSSLFEEKDQIEGMKAYLEKRKASFLQHK